MEKRISLAEARSRVYTTYQKYFSGKPPRTEELPIDQCLGRILAQTISASFNLPAHAISQMDGYAVNTATFQMKKPLTVLGFTPAGSPPYRKELTDNDAIKIFTGSVLPASATGIILNEWCHKDNDAAVRSAHQPEPGLYIRPHGSDFMQGDTLVEAGSRLNARTLQLAAANNFASLRVRRPLRCLLLATGDELCLPGEPAVTQSPYRIVASSLIGLKSLLAEMSSFETEVRCLKDDGALLARTLRDAGDAYDLIFTLGGASAGDYDIVSGLWKKQTASVIFRHINIVPGKPTWLVETPVMPILSFAGNPVSMYVGAWLLIPPLLAAYNDSPLPKITMENACCTDAIEENGQREAFLRSVLLDSIDGSDDKIQHVSIMPEQNSHQQYNLAKANCLTYRPFCAPALPSGSIVKVILLDKFIPSY